jgi:hypothetical protein
VPTTGIEAANVTGEALRPVPVTAGLPRTPSFSVVLLGAGSPGRLVLGTDQDPRRVQGETAGLDAPLLPPEGAFGVGDRGPQVWPGARRCRGQVPNLSLRFRDDVSTGEATN